MFGHARVVSPGENALPQHVPRFVEDVADLGFEVRQRAQLAIRLDVETGTCDFLEVNLQANLWSEKVFGRSAARAGLSQAELIETILFEGLRRHGLLDG